MGSGTYRATTRSRCSGGGLMKNRVLAAIGGFGFAFGAFAGVGTMEGGHVWLGLAIIAMALACGCLAVLVARSEALSEIEERGVCHRRSRRDRF